MKYLLDVTLVFTFEILFTQALILPPPFGANTPNLAHGYSYADSQETGPVTDVSTANAPGTHTRQINYLTAQCQMGLWDHGFDNKLGPHDWITHSDPSQDGHYQGYIIDDVGEDTCVDLKVLFPTLPNTVSSYRVTGYCECDFFDDPGCNNFRFSAFNREDNSLNTNGPDNDNLESVRCRTTNHAEQVQNCALNFFANSNHIIIHDLIDAKNPEDWSAAAGISGCRVFPPGTPLISNMRIEGCTCIFYDDVDCRGNQILWVGNGGVTDQYDVLEDAKLKSYRCWAPWGIIYTARTDDTFSNPKLI
ncbi:hypothetical protein TWF694_008363 [Orbilia ellipsospora]|uniref:Uncharacterized protein n=1 Tax=Orbilia ellipsospora TaxID=2528407 RepID=A0AAV9XJA5_9PEZI